MFFKRKKKTPEKQVLLTDITTEVVCEGFGIISRCECEVYHYDNSTVTRQFVSLHYKLRNTSWDHIRCDSVKLDNGCLVFNDNTNSYGLRILLSEIVAAYWSINNSYVGFDGSYAKV